MLAGSLFFVLLTQNIIAETIKKWDYQVESYNVLGLDKRTAKELTVEFDKMGNQGWRIISILKSERGQMLVTYKRQKE